MIETSFTVKTSTVRSPRQALLTLVREACEMLLVTHPSVVGGVTVSRTLDDASAARLVGRTAVRLAEEYGVVADVRTDGKAVVVRLARDGHIHKDRSNGRHVPHNGALHNGSKNP